MIARCKKVNSMPQFPKWKIQQQQANNYIINNVEFFEHQCYGCGKLKDIDNNVGDIIIGIRKQSHPLQGDSFYKDDNPRNKSCGHCCRNNSRNGKRKVQSGNFNEKHDYSQKRCQMKNNPHRIGRKMQISSFFMCRTHCSSKGVDNSIFFVSDAFRKVGGFPKPDEFYKMKHNKTQADPKRYKRCNLNCK